MPQQEEKTALEWFTQAKADGHEWADAAIENITRNCKREYLHEALSVSFKWGSTLQGYEFWEKIYDGLRDKSE